MAPESPAVDPAFLNALRWRCIGPPRGGRVVAVAADPVNPAVCYFGACAGGVWKSDDGGTYWTNVSDGYFKTAAVGALDVAPSDPNVIYAGTGEATIRIDVSHGDGVYKSTDAGQSWTHVGLSDTRHIGKLRVHPQDPDTVYVAALGHAFGRNEERGVFRTRDGGATWEKVLYKSDKAGAIDIVIDPHNPRILYAALWEAYRNFWTLSSGGPDSGLYRSTDGGDTWAELSDRPGLPQGIKGKIGVALSPARTGRVWALVEAEEPGFYRSDDGGETWAKMTDNGELRRRPWYFSHVVADPIDADTVYVLNIKMWKSTDGGKTFDEVTTPHGDNHDLWIDPRDPRRMVQGNDGGACVSYNGGASWSSIYNQLTAQFYHVATDNQFPYRVYGTQQDNSSVSVPSRSGFGAITWAHCYPAGTGESGHIAVHPENPDIVYVGAVGSSPGGGGALQRYDHRTKQIRLVTVWPEVYGGWGAGDLNYRFPWTFPIAFSPHDPNTLYTCGNIAFRSRDEGTTWEAFSPDLTRAEPETLLPAGGPITKDTTGAEHYATIFAFVESPHEPGVFWAGSDDGLIHISRDNGETWRDVTPDAIPPFTMISTIEASPHDPETAYVAATRYKLDDFRPMLFKTTDMGRTWTAIGDGIPDHDFTRVIRADPARPGLLYAGTETGVYVSFDDGRRWQPLQANLPVAPIHDLAVKENDLVAATHGRSFWILDDLTALHQLGDDVLAAEVALLTPRATVRLPTPISARWFARTEGKMYHVTLGTNATYYATQNDAGETIRTFLDAGQDPPEGVLVHYFLREAPEGEVTLRFRDAAGEEIIPFSSVATPPPEDDPDAPKTPVVPAQAGMNRFVWDMRYPAATRLPGDRTTNPTAPLAPPGRYQVELTVGDVTETADFDLLADPRVNATETDYAAQFELLLAMRDKLSTTHAAISRLRSMRDQAQGWVKRLAGQAGVESIVAAGEALVERLTAVENELVQTKALSPADDLNVPSRLTKKLDQLPSVVASADAVPTQAARDVFDHLTAQIDAQLAILDDIVATDVAAFNQLARAQAVPAIVDRAP